MGEKRNSYNILVVKPDLDVEGRIILKHIVMCLGY
jgi:hypothetical protein